VNAPDGPTLETREALRIAQEQGIPAVTLSIENLELIQDEELTELITEELYAIRGRIWLRCEPRIYRQMLGRVRMTLVEGLTLERAGEINKKIIDECRAARRREN
jgi:hypothetical protein